MRQSFLTASWALSCVLACALVGCSDDDATRDAAEPSDAGDADLPLACDVVAPTACSEPAPKFADVQPIFTKQCGICHGQDWSGQWPLDTYSHVADWADVIQAELASCSMPPADGGVTIKREDRMKILNWIRCGVPR